MPCHGLGWRGGVSKYARVPLGLWRRKGGGDPTRTPRAFLRTIPALTSATACVRSSGWQASSSARPSDDRTPAAREQPPCARPELRFEHNPCAPPPHHTPPRTEPPPRHHVAPGQRTAGHNTCSRYGTPHCRSDSRAKSSSPEAGHKTAMVVTLQNHCGSHNSTSCLNKAVAHIVRAVQKSAVRRLHRLGVGPGPRL